MQAGEEAGKATISRPRPKMHADSHERSGITRVGILVVFIVLAVLLALAIPAILQSREVARRAHARII